MKVILLPGINYSQFKHRASFWKTRELERLAYSIAISSNPDQLLQLMTGVAQIGAFPFKKIDKFS